jgi:hypothetical protein
MRNWRSWGRKFDLMLALRKNRSLMCKFVDEKGYCTRQKVEIKEIEGIDAEDGKVNVRKHPEFCVFCLYYEHY